MHRTADPAGSRDIDPAASRDFDPAGHRPADPHDIRLVPFALATWAAVGIGLGAPTSVVATAGLLSGTGALVALLVALRLRGYLAASWVPQVALVLGGLATALAVVTFHHADREAHPLTLLAAEGSEVVVEGVVLGDPDTAGRGQERFVLDLRTVAPAREPASARDPAPADAGGTVLVLAPPGEHRLRVGATVEVVGDARPTGRAEAEVALIFADDPVRETAPPTGALGAVDVLREGLRGATDTLPPQARGLVPGIALGDDRALPADLEDAARVTGLTHLTAVSGAHVSLVLAAVLGIVGRGRPRLAALIGPAVVVALVVLVRPEPSVLRAGATGGVVLLAGLLGRPARALPALATAVVVLLLADPALARSYGLVLSAGATAAIILLARPLARLLSAGVPRWLAHGLAIPAAAQLACAPVLALLDPRLAMTAVPANVLAAPAVPGATVLGLGAALVSPLSADAAHALATVASWHTAWIAWVALTLAGAPAATVPWPGGALGVVLLAACTVLCCVAVARTATTGARVRALVVVMVAPGIVSVAPTAPGAGSPQGWVVRQCDVGQASALLVRTGQGSAVLVDTGDADGSAATCVADAEVDTLDAVVLTHDHADHTAGLPAVLDVAEVDEILVPAVDGASPLADALEAVADSGATARVREVGTGAELDWRGVTAEVLLPRVGTRASPDDSSAVNESSMALLVELPAARAGGGGGGDTGEPDSHVRLVVAGDLEEAGQGRLARVLVERAPSGVDIVVVPHHGSGNLDPALAEVTSPVVALVSSGADNDHGHPAPRAVETWSAVGARVARTDECGDLWLVPGSGGSLTLVGCG
ncbi:ComEC/Rec2 family competence protein [Georgenia sp. Z1491]|uniref:ComEC/Rec2 family competence protein n=1 Tax=Georgenia sp. Z1491 TaxID=3416707 RepID=UPI003CEB984E